VSSPRSSAEPGSAKGDIHVVYVSQTGLTEPLGQSQVVAYLERLRPRGISFEVLSMEPAGTSSARLAEVRERLTRSGIAWYPLPRHASHHLSRKALESLRLGARTLRRVLSRRPDIVHARAHFPGAIADLVSSVTPGARFLFDCRGLLGDQYVDVGHWTKDRLEYRMLKAWERRAFRRADGLVVLTSALERLLLQRDLVPVTTPRAVIPCCVELDHFVPDDAVRREVRAELGLGERPVVAHAGGLGAWYLEDEIAAFAAHFRRTRPDVALLVMTRTDPTRLQSLLRERGFGPGDVVVRDVRPEQMPRMLAAVDVGLSLIRPAFGVTGTSPTKFAEYLAMGVIGVANEGVGDMAELRAYPGSCIVCPDLGDDALRQAAERAATLLELPRAERVAAGRAVASELFSVDGVGAVRYEALYRQMLGRSPGARASDREEELAIAEE